MFYKNLVKPIFVIYNYCMNKENYRTLSIDIDNPLDQQTLVVISRALSNIDRIKILNLLNDGPLSIVEIKHLSVNNLLECNNENKVFCSK